VALTAASLLLAFGWALVSPPFEAPDETAHFGYVQSLAEDGALPGDPKRISYSREQIVAINESNSDQAAAQPAVKMEWNRTAYEHWRREAHTLDRTDGGGPNSASANPPLYYLAEAGAYVAFAGSDLFGRLLAMRLASALWLAVSVIAAWLLAGEALGRDRLAQLAAAGLVGLAPMMTFVSASVSPDSMLIAMWTTAFWLGVRILRRGLDVRSAAAFFGVVGLAIVVKAASYALLPAAALVLAVGLYRRADRRPARVAGVLGAALTPLAVIAGSWFVVAHASTRPAAAQISAVSHTSGFNLRELLSYIWQFYLPRLPFQNDFPTVAHTIPVYDIWIKGLWGSFGWTEIVFPNRVYVLIAILMLIVVVAAMLELWRARAGADKAIVAFLGLAALSLFAGLHWTEYNQIRVGVSNFNQGRYLLPLAGVAGIVVALAIRRLAPAKRPLAVAGMLGGLLVLQVFSMALVLQRFYA
jgi:hypothetical protein